MKTKLTFITTCAFVFALLTNCTIEKRIFQKGYYIEWKKKSSDESARTETNKLSDASDAPDIPSERQVTNEIAVKQDSKKDSVTSNKKASEAKPVSVITNSTNEQTASARKINSSDPVTITSKSSTEQAETTPVDQKDDDPRLETKPKIFEPVGIVSFGFYFLAVILGLCAITAVNPIAVLGFTALLLLASLILGIISVVRYRRNRDLYHRNFFGFFGLIAAGSTLILGLFIVTFIVLGSLFYY